MPWTPEDAQKHTKKASTPKLQKQWSDIANSARDKCMADGGKDKECSMKAIMMANGVIAKQMEDGKSFYYLTDISNIELQVQDNKKSSWIEIFRVGKWNHPKHGIIEGTKKLFNDFINNWKSNVLGREIALDKTHNPEEGATGWVKDMKIEGDRLKAFIEWTPWGVELIEQKGFKYFSPEYRDSFTNKETGQIHNNVLFGGALTNRPFLTDLAPVILSEDISLHQTAIAKSMPMDQSPLDYLDLVNPFVDIIRQLCYGGYIDQNELKDFVLTHLSKVDFSKVTMSEEFKKEITNLLEEYLEDG